MMGGHHAASGAAAWVAVASTAPYAFGWYPVTPLGIVTGALLTAGAALLPDLDHHSGTIAHSLPPVTKILARLTEAVSGGHRRGTHSLLGLAVFVALATALGRVTADVPVFGSVAVGAGILSVLLMGFAFKALKIAGGPVRSWFLALAFSGFIAVYAPENNDWLPVAVGLGVAVHIVGDLLTHQGVMILWPLRIKRPRSLTRFPVVNKLWRSSGSFSLPLIGAAGSWREWALMVPVTIYAIFGVTLDMLTVLTGWSPYT
ncbi:metal-dependent hydrolase [Arthrobacter sp. zg-Y877]|uniref:metal-dependent hydrolase n=1 Tax=Arthrobacter sp. zg-Y877 TaxID=3049074 RepID=UPI0025A499EA|nr:metal-dependent hydrolase [Arthrobacter sp. zg-Y877]MDM7991095.1 metal-dependent hydrolase [Arthrobacter sp. zg-Y877]